MYALQSLQPSFYVYPGIAPIPYALDGILNTVCDAAEVSIADVCSKNRKVELVAARQLYCWFARKHTDYTFGQIGNMLGVYNHSTVIHSVKKVNDMIAIKDPLITDMFNKIKPRLQKEQAFKVVNE